LIQVVRYKGFRTDGSPRFMTAKEQHLARADSLDAWTTPAHYHIDIAPDIKSPYVTIGRPYRMSKPGRSGAVLDTAQWRDIPLRDDIAYPDAPDTIVKILLDFEINAICAEGAAKGQYLGSCVWQWQRTRGAFARIGRITLQPQCGLGQPSATFKEAVQRWADRLKFQLPTSPFPKKGGSACP